MWNDLISACLETLLMTFGAGLATLFIGLPLGIALYLTHAPHFYPCPIAHHVMSAMINPKSSSSQHFMMTSCHGALL